MKIGGIRISKKLTTTILFSLVIILNKALELDISQQELAAMTAAVSSYLIGQSAVDFRKEEAKPHELVPDVIEVPTSVPSGLN